MDAIKVWHGLPATFTPPDSHGTFVPLEHRHKRYISVAEVMVTLAAASFCVLYSLGFMALLTYFYERYLRLH
jgi:hypothetical protein